MVFRQTGKGGRLFETGGMNPTLSKPEEIAAGTTSDIKNGRTDWETIGQWFKKR